MDGFPVVSSLAIYQTSDGALVLLAPAGTPLRTGQASVALPDGFGEDTFKWDPVRRVMVEQIGAVEANMIAAIKTAAEQKKMGAATPGGYKKTEYAAKRQEVIEWDKLGLPPAVALAAFNALNAKVAMLRFEWAMADAAAMGDTVDKAIERFRAGMLQAMKNGDTPAKIAGREQRAVKDMKAAGNRAAKAAVTAAFTSS